MATSTYRKIFKNFTKTLPGFDHAEDMAKEFYLGSDRAAVILQAAAVERLLEGILVAKMRSLTEADHERIFEGNGPLATFSHKTMVGFALGLYGPVFRHDLDLIRELRNGFAHVRLPMKLTQPEVAGMCQNLRMADPISGLPSALPAAYSGLFELEIAADDSHPRTRFTRACHSISLCFLDLGQFLIGLGGVDRTLP